MSNVPTNKQKAIILVGNADEMRALSTSKSLTQTFEEANPLGYARIRQSFLMACLKTPKLYECDRVSVIDAMCKAVAYNLEVDGVMGRAYIIPRWSGRKQCLEAVFQIGYKGLCELFYRANQGGVCFGSYACDGDEFDYNLGTDPQVSMKKARGERLRITHFWAYYQLASGRRAVEVMTVDEMIDFCSEYRSDADKVSKDKNYKGVWDVRFDAMGIKTVMSRLLKYAPQSAEAQRALAEDEYAASGKYSIEQVGDDPTQTHLVHDDDGQDDVTRPPATNAEPARRMRMGTKKNTGTEAGTSVSTKTGGGIQDGKVDSSVAAPVVSEPLSLLDEPTPCQNCGEPMIDGACMACDAKQAAANAEAKKLIAEREQWVKGQADAASTPEGRAKKSVVKAAKESKEPTTAAQADLLEGVYAAIPWMEMTSAEVFETWQTVTDPKERQGRWGMMNPAEQAKIVAAVKEFKPAPATAPAQTATTEPAQPAPADEHRIKAEAFIKAMPSPDAQSAWVMANRYLVESTARARYIQAAGLNPKKMLNENPPDVMEAFAISLATWLLKENKAFVTVSGQPVAGRPRPR